MHADSVTKTARKLGLLYFLLALLMVLNESLISAGFTVTDNPAATAQNIMASEFRYRLGLLASFAGQCLSVPLVIGLYYLFRDVDKKQALLMLVFSLLGTALMLATLQSRLLTFTLLGGGNHLSAFTEQQLEVLSFVFQKLRAVGTTLVTTFWGLWLFPFGVLVIRSKMFPKILGYCLFVAGFGYVISSVTAIAFPVENKALASYLMPLYFGELPIIFWMLIKGAKVPDTNLA